MWFGDLQSALDISKKFQSNHIWNFLWNFNTSCITSLDIKWRQTFIKFNKLCEHIKCQIDRQVKTKVYPLYIIMIFLSIMIFLHINIDVKTGPKQEISTRASDNCIQEWSYIMLHNTLRTNTWLVYQEGHTFKTNICTFLSLLVSGFFSLPVCYTY